jgi:hypothetical protein
MFEGIHQYARLQNSFACQCVLQRLLNEGMVRVRNRGIKVYSSSIFPMYYMVYQWNKLEFAFAI